MSLVHRILGMGVLCAALMLGACSHGAPVQNPAPIAAGASTEATEQAILDVLPKRGWTAEDVQPGRIVAFLSVRQFMLRVEIRYDAQQVQIAYLDSDHLDAHQEDGQVYAHRKVNGWMKNLARDISTALLQAGQPTAGGETAPPA